MCTSQFLQAVSTEPVIDSADASKGVARVNLVKTKLEVLDADRGVQVLLWCARVSSLMPCCAVPALRTNGTDICRGAMCMECIAKSQAGHIRLLLLHKLVIVLVIPGQCYNADSGELHALKKCYNC